MSAHRGDRARAAAAYGTWRSVITADDLVHGVSDLGYVSCAGERTYWVETSRSNPSDPRLVYAGPDGVVHQALPPDHPVRSGMNGYGALPYGVHGAVVSFVNAADQGLYQYEPGGGALLLAAAADGRATRYGAPVPGPEGEQVYCVRERDLGSQTVHDLVAVPADGSGRVRVLSSGHDFYGAPALHPDGSRIAFTVWDHPHMAWDQSVLREIRLDGSGAVAEDRLVAGSPEESITQPRYSRDGRLHFVSDRTGWWNLYAEDSDGRHVPQLPIAAEFGRPDWTIGLQTYGFLGDGTLIAACRRRGKDTLMRIPVEGSASALPGPYDVVDVLSVSADGIAAVAGSSSLAPAVVRIDGHGRSAARVVRESRPDPVGAEWISVPQPLAFPTTGGQTAHAFHYAPVNPHFTGPAGTPPPLIVFCHGGPTTVSSAALNYQIQYWTSRGFAVVEVNYGGSSGHGRAYRERIRGQWGVTDIADCVNAARHLVSVGAADPGRLAIRGLSSGGLTALGATAAAASEFAAVVSYFGVTDLTDIPARTHKMESRYLDGLIGPWPERRDVYESRSPLRNVARMRTPALLFHGRGDTVVPVEQTERLARSLIRADVPVCQVTYEDEGHGFSRPENVRNAASVELLFLGKILGFEPDLADRNLLVEIVNSGQIRGVNHHPALSGV